MNWKGIEIDKLQDADLVAAKIELDKMSADVQAKRSSDAYIARMQNQIVPHINPVFLDLQKEVDLEIGKRGLK